MKILGREPAAWVASLGALLVVLASFGAPFVDGAQAAAITAALMAVVLLVTTRPIAPAVVTGVVTSGVAVLTAYGLHLSDLQVGSLTGAALAVFSLLTRQQVASQPTAISAASPGYDPRTGVSVPTRRL